MAHTYSRLLFHYVFSTKERTALITDAVRDRLHAYMTATARENGATLAVAGGTDNHAHILLGMPPRLAPSALIGVVKGSSSKWMNDTFPGRPRFHWQESFSVFSLSPSLMGKTVDYIGNQARHHRKRSFEEEVRLLLEKSGIDYDETYLWG